MQIDFLALFERVMPVKYKRIIVKAVTALVTALAGILFRKGIDLFFKLVEKWTSMLLTNEWLCVILYL